MDQQWKLEQRNILLRMEILQNLAKRGNAFTGPLFWPNKTFYESKKAERR